jgi:hypothetical protein
VNPVTGKVYVANADSSSVTVVTDAPVRDTKVRAAFDRLPGDTTSMGRPALTGKGVNRSSPDRTAMMGVLNRLNTAQKAWDWAAITSGAGTDSVTWTYTWGADSLILGENFVCAVPLEAQAAITDNLGLGSPFTGNLEVYPVYRVGLAPGVEESPKPQAAGPTPQATVIRGVLLLPPLGTRSELPERNSVMSRAVLLDAAGRKVIDLRPGANDVRSLAPGVYFVTVYGERNTVHARKVVVTR